MRKLLIMSVMLLVAYDAEVSRVSEGDCQNGFTVG